jgi:hypothetical protein
VKRLLAHALVLVALVAPAIARAEQPALPPRNALSLEIPSLFNAGLAIQYERFVLPPIFSVVTGAGMRRSGGDEYDVLDVGFGAEGRFWLLGRAPFSRWDRRAMVGPYLALGLDFGIVREWHQGHVLGTTMRVGQHGSVGARFAILRRFEITPSLGAGLRTEIDARGRLAPWSRPELIRLGLTAGVLF